MSRCRKQAIESCLSWSIDSFMVQQNVGVSASMQIWNFEQCIQLGDEDHAEELVDEACSSFSEREFWTRQLRLHQVEKSARSILDP